MNASGANALIRSGDREIQLAQVMERARQAASGLASLGVGFGDTIAVYLQNDFAFFEATFAAGILGAYPVAVNWHYTPDEARYLFQDSKAKAVVIHADLLKDVADAIPRGTPVLVVPTPPEIQAAYRIAERDCAVPSP